MTFANSPSVIPHALPEMPLQTLRTVSPSRFHDLKACPLREVWAAGRGVSCLLPLSPQARVGTVIHKIHEMAWTGQITSEEVAAREWDERIAQQESHISESWLERHLSPLSVTLDNLHVKRGICLHTVRDIFAGTNKFLTMSPELLLPLETLTDDLYSTTLPAEDDTRLTGSEVRVWSADAKLKGSIDLVLESPEGFEISDYKTGRVLDINTGVVKESYQQQLKIYAALFHHKSCGIWPAKLTVIDPYGARHNVAFTAEECLTLSQQATELYDQVKAQIETGAAPETLACPGPQTCNFCPFRPACRAYWQAREPGGDWPNDVRGTVTDIRTQGNGNQQIKLESDAGTAWVSDLQITRHACLTPQSRGRLLSCYNVVPEKQTPDRYLEGPMTTIYIG